MKNINTSLFDFPTLRDPKRNYIYVDKTAQLYEIVKPTADGNVGPGPGGVGVFDLKVG